jgi:T5SS/PEP-CTERM-associated repeat protein
LAAVSFSGDVTFNTIGPGATFQIGNQSFGSFRIDGGSVYSSGAVSIGQNQSAFGVVTVTGDGSQWNISGSADVGSAGMGQLNILDGAIVNLTQFGLLQAGVTASGHGTVVVRNPGSILQVTRQLLLGFTGGSASLEIADGGVVNATTGFSKIGSLARVDLDDGTLRCGTLHQAGVIVGSGDIIIMQSAAQTTNAGRIEAGAGDYLRVVGTGTLQNQGIIAADGGTIEVHRNVSNVAIDSKKAEITLRNGTVRIGGAVQGPGAPLENSGLLAAIGGQNDFYGVVENVQGGQIAVMNESVLIFHDDVTADSGTISVFPGSKAIFLEDLELSETAVVQANLPGADGDTGFGIIEVVGNLALGDGTLEVTVEGPYVPQLGDTFPLITAGGGISGSLSLSAMPGLPDVLAWDLDIDSSHVLLSVVPALAGDYNASGMVDAADYVVWRKLLNQAGTGLVPDGDDNNMVNDADYQIWRTNFGASIDAAAAGAAAIPEPAAAWLACVGAAAISLKRGKTKYRGRYFCFAISSSTSFANSRGSSFIRRCSIRSSGRPSFSRAPMMYFHWRSRAFPSARYSSVTSSLSRCSEMASRFS